MSDQLHPSDAFCQRYGVDTVAQMLKYRPTIGICQGVLDGILNTCSAVSLVMNANRLVDMAMMAASTLMMIHESRAPKDLIRVSLDMVLAYVHLRNSLRLTNSWLVGEEHEKIEYIYHSIIATHQDAVGDCMQSIEDSGVAFASKIRSREENLALYVSTWEQDYTFRRVYGSVACMPNCRPITHGTVVVFDHSGARGLTGVVSGKHEPGQPYVIDGTDGNQYSVREADVVAINDPGWNLAKRAPDTTPAKKGTVRYADRRGCWPVFRKEPEINRALD
jgi:hypothetical protein